jgi:hypothetical protein
MAHFLFPFIHPLKPLIPALNRTAIIGIETQKKLIHSRT